MGLEVLGAVSIGSSILGSGLSALGASKKADAESDALAYKAQVARNNAIIAERNAASAVEAGSVKGQINDLRTKSLVGQQLVAQAANGLDVNSGSNLAVRQSTADIGRLDTLTIIANAGKEAVGYLAAAEGYESEAVLQDMGSRYAREAGEINVATSLLGGATSVSDKYLSFKSKGVFT